MTKAFDQTQWTNAAFSKSYLESADHIIQERSELFRVFRAFYRKFIGTTTGASFCDLGCGDGILGKQLLEENASLHATLVDGSAKMLDAAKERLKQYPACQFVQAPFTSLKSAFSEDARFDLIISGFAIHHLSLPEKATLFQTVHDLLKEGGWFLNMDTTFPDDPFFTDWYYENWQSWVDIRDRDFGLGGAFSEISSQARSNPDNQLSPLGVQLELLRAAGFGRVDCHYKNGLFSIFGGQRGVTHHLSCSR